MSCWRLIYFEISDLAMNKSHLQKIQGDLRRIISSTDYYFGTASPQGTHEFIKQYDIDQFEKLAYVTFLLRLRANSISVKTLLDTNAINSWPLCHHSVAILMRSSLLDCLCVMAWSNDRDFVRQLLADSFNNLGKNKLWKLSDIQKENLNRLRDMFCNSKIDIRPAKILELAGDEALPVYLLYDLYSKSDHFSVLDSMVFKMSCEDQLTFLEQAVLVVIETTKALYLMFEQDRMRCNVLITKLGRSQQYSPDVPTST